MSDFLKNQNPECGKNPEQCRTHHQKMLKKHGSISMIKKNYYEEKKLKEKKKQEKDQKNKKKRSRRTKLPIIAEKKEFKE